MIYARWRPRAAPARGAIRLSLRQRERFFAALATAESAGLPPLSAIEMASADLPPALAEALRADRIAGRPLSQTLGRLGILEGAERAFLEAGEARGALAATRSLLARRAADRRRDRDRMLLLLAYPTLLLLAFAGIGPLPLLFRRGLAAYAAAALPPVAGVILGGAIVLAVLPRLDPASLPRRLLRRIGLALPGTGHALRDGAIATFLDVLGGCIAAGISVRQALPLAASAAGHPPFDPDRPLRRLDAGATLAEALASIAWLPPTTLGRIAGSERTGTLDAGLAELAAEHRRRARLAAAAAGLAIALVFAALVVGVLALSVIEGFRGYLDTIEGAVGEVAVHRMEYERWRADARDPVFRG